MIIPILKVPDPRLRQVSVPVRGIEKGVVRLMEEMLETMYAAPGIGLSAPQVGILQRILVVDLAGHEEEKSQRDPLCIANPEILWASAESSGYNEGCLSLPDQYATVHRPSRILVRYLDRHNRTCDCMADGLLATVIQHEIDHLDGVLFVDHLSRLRRGMITRRLQRARRLRQPA